MSEEDKKDFEKAEKCYTCNKKFEKEEDKKL